MAVYTRGVVFRIYQGSGPRGEGGHFFVGGGGGGEWAFLDLQLILISVDL